jgi:tetratricopeptide (TPR) repeat protein
MLEDLIQLHRAGRLDEAESGYRRLLIEQPDNPEVLHLLGIVRGQRGDMHEALELVRRAGELDPDNPTCQHTLGEMYLREHRLDEAEAAYVRARVLNPNLATAHSGLGQIAFLRGDVAAAESHFKVALRADQNDVQALTGLGNAARMRGDSQGALQWLNQAAELASDDPLIQAGYAQAMLDQDMLDFAARALDNALTVKPDYPLARALRAEVHVRKGEVAAALPIYESLLARGEQVAPARAGLGDIARAQGRHDEAIAQYDEALRLQPDLHSAAVRRADALAHSGRLAQAIDDLRTYIADHPDGVKAHIALAQLLMKAGRFDDALATWTGAETRWPDNVDLKAQHALALDRAGRLDEALALADAAMASQRPALVMLRARGALLAGDPAAAVQRLRSIDDASLQGKTSQFARRRQRLLGLAYDALEQWQDAAQAFIAMQRLTAGGLPSLPTLDTATSDAVRRLAAAAELADARAAPPPVFLCGLPGSGVRQVAALLADQPGWFVRRERFETAPDFVNAAFEPRFAQDLSATDLVALASRYRRAQRRAGAADSARVADWVPLLDVRIVPVIKRALPGARLLLVGREPHDMLLNWLGFGRARGFAMPDPLTGARWLRLAQSHLELAAELLPTFRADPDVLLAANGEDARMQLGVFLGVDALEPGPLARSADRGHGGLPAGFPAGHADHYREALSEALAALDDMEMFALP